MKLPGTTALRRDDTHRLIPTKYIGEGEGEGESVLSRLTVDDEDLDRLLELEGATNDRLLGEAGLLPGISVHELVFGISYAHIVNAAFTHAHSMGSRFNLADRGAWYAAFALETSQAEVAFHKAQDLQEINWQDEEVATYADYLADFRADFHDIRGESEFVKCLDPDSYQNSQRLARQLLKEGSPGIVYPSVRHKGGTCLACFRPALVINVRRGPTVALTFKDAILARVTVEKGGNTTQQSADARLEHTSDTQRKIEARKGHGVGLSDSQSAIQVVGSSERRRNSEHRVCN